jgi:predicted ferric reductase
VRVFKPLFMLRRPYRVASVKQERGDTTTLVMEPDGHAGFRFTPGQFGWLTLWRGPFRITGHPFSFSSSAEAPGGRVEMTIRNLGDFTSRVHTAVVGQRVWLDGPYGAFTIGNPADMHVLVAGGIGITPMMSMLRTLADRGDKRPVILFYGSKDLESTHLPRGTSGAASAARTAPGACAGRTTGGLVWREWTYRCRPFGAPSAPALCRT